jgi:molecular chaperone DnaJ
VAKKDYYESLGIAREADESEINRAYRQNAKDLHTHLNPYFHEQDEEHFKRTP